MKLTNDEILKYNELIQSIINFFDEGRKLLLKDYQKYIPEEKQMWLNNIDLRKDMLVTEIPQEKLVFYENDIFYLYLNKFEEEYNKLKNSKHPDNPYYSVGTYQKYDDIKNSKFTQADLTILITYKNMDLKDIVIGQFFHEIFKSLINLNSNKNLSAKIGDEMYEKNYGIYLKQAICEYLTREFFHNHNLKYLPNIENQDYTDIINELIQNGYEEKLFQNNLDDLFTDEMKKQIEDQEIEYFNNEIDEYIKNKQIKKLD